jgi:thiamine pyrophosphate-dependent acetolactate synthase large subunit-like protein
MNAAEAVAEVLRREGVEFLIAYPENLIIEAAAAADIRPVIVRQERTGLHMADALSRVSSGRHIGVFAMQFGPGAENSFGGIAQAFGESSPILVLPSGYPRRLSRVLPNFNAALNYRHITKWSEEVMLPGELTAAMRRAFSQVRNGRPRPVAVEFPIDLLLEEVPEPFEYRPTPVARAAPDPHAVEEVAEVLTRARRPVLYAGQGVHYGKAWGPLREIAEWLGAPVTTSLGGKSAFPESHPLSLGSGGRTVPKPVHHFLERAEVIFGAGCSFTATSYGIAMPRGKVIIHATLDPADIGKDVPADYVLLGDAQLTLEAVLGAVKERLRAPRREEAANAAREIDAVRREWLETWMPKLRSDEKPLSPYRVIWDLLHTVDVSTTIITHDAGSPRDQLSPFWRAEAPLSYLGWGKTTQLGYGLGLAMGAKLEASEKLCINVWGDAAIGFTGMDFETAVRERIPILSVLLNNSSMAIELPDMPVSTRKYRSTDISGNYAALAQALGGYGERVVEPADIVPAIRRGIRKTQDGVPALLEFITAKEIAYSLFR